MDDLQPFSGDQDERPPKKRRLSEETLAGDQLPTGDASLRPECINRVNRHTSSCKITELNFAHEGLSETDITELILYIQQLCLPALKILCLGENNISDSLAASLLDTLTDAKLKIIKLDINNNNFTDITGVALARFLRFNKELEYLDIGSCNHIFDEETLCDIMTAIGNIEGLKVLKLYGLSSDYLHLALKNKLLLEELDIQLAVLAETLCEQCAELINMPNLTNLNIADVDLSSPEAFLFLLDYLLSNTNLRSLHIGWTDLDTRHIRMLGCVLEKQHNLQVLNVSGFELSEATKMQLNELFGRLKSLEELSLQLCDITNLRDLLDAIKQSPIKKLNITGNDFYDIIPQPEEAFIKKYLEREIEFFY
jgi:hypothetical protein